MKKIVTVIMACAMTVGGIGLNARAGVIEPGLKKEMQYLRPDEEVPIIVTLADQVDLNSFNDKDKALRRGKIIKALKNKSEKTQKNITDFLKQNKAGKLKPFWIFNGLAVTAKVKLIEKLAGVEGIESIRLDATLSLAEPLKDSVSLPEWNISAINAPELWNMGYTGTETVLATMDTGVDASHQDLASRWRGGSNSWYDPNGEHATPYDSDTYGHGTRVMGIMVGGDAGGSFIGVAPGAQWIAVKIFNDAGKATLSGIHDGFQWLLDPDDNPETDDAPDVVNNSWGFPNLAGVCFAEFKQDIQALKAAQIGAVFSAGNGGPYDATSESPANYPESFAAGAVDTTLTITYFSARGPSACDGSTYPEVVAPGVSVLTADLGDSYATAAGTSFAAPHVAGAMGLLLSTDPSLSIGDIESAMADSAQDLGELGPDNVYGYGLLDVMGAYNLLSQNQPLCTDADLDGFYAEADCGTAMDCDDNADGTNPAACDIKGDGIDQDCDGSDRVKGKPCRAVADSGSDPGGDPVGVEGKGKSCGDRIDNDGDLLFDCEDPDCSKNKSCK
ncbi:MAG: S8 family serine peptidase [Desulfobulbaceae bacterium]|nr:S8 family serine peptidase [Desulfobulbaceae bacterium]